VFPHLHRPVVADRVHHHGVRPIEPQQVQAVERDVAAQHRRHLRQQIDERRRPGDGAGDGGDEGSAADGRHRRRTVQYNAGLAMPEWTPETGYVDLEFRGHARVVATAVLRHEGGIALVDPGPTSCLPTLERGLAELGCTLDEVTDVLVTHIHLDHAGAVGTISRRVPGARVSVHERGARHLSDPTRLIESATRLYGDQMDTLWGEMVPVAPSQLAVIRDGDEVRVGRRRLAVAYTPGHAVHHVSFLDLESRIAFVGDVAGVYTGGGYVRPPTPPV
jgi:glyoxylase-like metal-dependent hydrolase (beta-lactamase superfamily II)